MTCENCNKVEAALADALAALADMEVSRDMARATACRLGEEVIEVRENTRKPEDDTTRLDQVAKILSLYLGQYRQGPPLPPALCKALAIAERRR